MEPSNSTVFRFVAAYDKGFDSPAKRIVLGYGYMGGGGLNHAELVRLYLGDTMDFFDKIYAGYFTVRGKSVEIFSGGSGTLGVRQSKEREERLIEDLKNYANAGKAVANLGQLIMAGDLYHAMVAVR